MRVLVAEKDISTRNLIVTRLKTRQYDVVEVIQSEDLLRELERQTVDLILISSDMERIGGKLLVEKIREKIQFMALPIIMMTTEERMSELLMLQERGFDDFLIKPFNALVLQLRVALNIARNRVKVETNALTHLPGNLAIEKVIRKKIEQNEKMSVLYIDINQFKSFNDRNGFDQGDNVLRQTANILVRTAEKIVPAGEYFVGHVGGDDYVAVVHPDYEEPLARAFIAEFDRIIPTYYNEHDQKQGFIRVTNRRGKRETFPLMSCSVAVVNNLHRPYKNLGEIAQDAADLKSFLKSQPGSHYLRDRRHEPFKKLEDVQELLNQEMTRRKQTVKIDPLGQVLLDAGLIDQDSLSLALKKHLETGERLGQTLIRLNLIRSEDVGRMLEKKLNIPYVSLRKTVIPREILRLFTADFIKSHRVVPLELDGERIKLAMCDPFDLRTLDAIESITGFKPVPCLALEDEFEEFLEKRPGESVREEKIG